MLTSWDSVEGFSELVKCFFALEVCRSLPFFKKKKIKDSKKQQQKKNKNKKTKRAKQKKTLVLNTNNFWTYTIFEETSKRE